MRKFLIATTLAASTLAGVPAALAQPAPPAAPHAVQHPAQHQAQHQAQHLARPGPAWKLTPARQAQLRSDVQSLGAAIDQAAARRTISPRQATSLRREARRVHDSYVAYTRNGLSHDEVERLQQQVNRVHAALKTNQRHGDGRRG